MQKLSKAQIELLQKITDLHHRYIYFEDGSFFIYTLFDFADDKSRFFHKLVGRRFFLDDTRLGAITEATFPLFLGALKEENLWIHKDIKFICSE